MEMQFNKTAWECLMPAVSQTRSEEQTQEVRLPDAMPDIGKVLACWGQVLVRGKEWRKGGMTVTGGVMAWVMYAPEDGSEAQTVETWLPFQIKWDFPETERDGIMHIGCLLRQMDARSVSARKLMVRAEVSAHGEAMVPSRVDVCVPGEMPEDIQLLRRSYSVRIPREAGEKMFELDEDIVLPASAGGVRKIVRYALQPEVIDRKVMAGKAVFRGIALVHILYCGEDGQLRTWDAEVPFSQFTDLERDYDTDAEVRILLAVTSLELDKTEEGNLHLRAGVTGQYVVYDQPVLQVVEDAYSTTRTVTPEFTDLQLPAVLDDRRETLRLEAGAETNGDHAVDVTCWMEQPVVRRGESGMELEVSCTFQVLTSDRQGTVQGQTVRAQNTWSAGADEHSRIRANAMMSGMPQTGAGAGEVRMWADVLLDIQTTTDNGIPMVTGLTVGEEYSRNEKRPSVILCRAGEEGLWELAKVRRTTVDAIRKANKLEADPPEGQMLLIPMA